MNDPYGIYSTEPQIAPVYASFLGFAGIASAMIFSTMGAAYGTMKAGQGIAGIGSYRPDLVMKSLIPVVMAGIIAVYGLVISVLISQDIRAPPDSYSLFSGVMHLAAGLSVGLCGLASGYCIGVVGEAGVRAFMQEQKVYVGMVLILIFGEVLGLYGYKPTNPSHDDPITPDPPTPDDGNHNHDDLSLIRNSGFAAFPSFLFALVLAVIGFYFYKLVMRRR
ncbi:related to vacuolar ATP synthase proteolipid subunit [Cephalotrichum gorgonifer]|uniref:V-type proton ATPase proteolipid subunit n=1 Tax=Cephalotrichum gorgonifer TaxID=2041049 RepID=A0AAE8MVJ1_9PEZI|nr:related to vacuolar ATP synthase proteolipid subunit [Cephalotrichum gorgonifer]